MQDLERKRVKLVVLGAEAVGKTAIVRRFLHDSFQVGHMSSGHKLWLFLERTKKVGLCL